MFYRSLDDYVILHVDSFEDLTYRFGQFGLERVSVDMRVEKTVGSGLERQQISVPVTSKDDLVHFLQKAKDRTESEREVQLMMEKRDELGKRVDEVLPVIEKYIAEHYLILKI